MEIETVNVKHGNSPVNTKFKYKIKNESEIIIDFDDFNDSNNHIRMIKNTIIYAIILFFQNSKAQSVLKKIHLQSKNNKGLFKNTFLPLIHNHSRYFDLEISPTPINAMKYKFHKDWKNGIKKNIEFSTSEVIEKVSSMGLKDYDKLMYYKTVSNSSLQIRYMGYQIGKWNNNTKTISPKNNTEISDFKEFAENIIQNRSNKNHKKFNEKEEHYLESILIDKINKNSLSINNMKISKIFTKSNISFQFPALMKPGRSNNQEGNSPKYIDILAKSGNRPVVMELKIWNKGEKKNSRGEYMFSAFSQVLSYYNYLANIFGKKDTPKEKKEGLEEIYNLKWEEPIIYIIINDIGDDEKAEIFRGYIKKIMTCLIKQIDLSFVEIENTPWREFPRQVIVKRIISSSDFT